MDCPKCGTARDEARTHCRVCGLAHAKMSEFAATREAGAGDALAQAWQAATEHWDDDARHDEVLRLAHQHDAYAWAAARYRERAKQFPNDTSAKDHLGLVARAAETALVASALTRKDTSPSPYRNTMAILGLMIIAIIAGLVYVVARGDEPAKPHRDPNPPVQAK